MKRVCLLILGGLVCFSCISGLLFGGIFCFEARAEDPPQFAWKIPQSKYYFHYPHGIAVDSNDNVYVADTYNERIQKFNSDGTFVNTWGSEGSGAGQFKWPFGIAIDSSDNVYVADTYNERIQKFNSDGTFMITWGRHGSEDGQFNDPCGIVVDSSGNIYIADSCNNRIQKFSADGTFMNTWGSYGSEDGQFNNPRGLVVDSSGNVYIADTGNHRIQKFIYYDTAGFTISAVNGHTTEQGGLATFTLHLNTQPSDNVTVGISSSTTQEGMVSPASLTFTPANWDTPQTVTITGIDDDIDDGDTHYTIITEQASSSDENYDGLNPQDVSVINNDDDTTNITITPAVGLVTRENQVDNTATFSVVLDSEPIDEVTIDISSSDLTEGTVAPESLSFHSGNWNIPQVVTITGVDDLSEDGNRDYTITIKASSLDEIYNEIPPSNITVTNNDNDSANITINPIAGLTTFEDGASATFSIVLDTQPAEDVTIGFESADVTEGQTSSESLVFTSSNWHIPQTITITPVDDDIDDGDVPYTIVTSVSSSDTHYSPLDPPDVSVINTDDDIAGIRINSAAGLITSELGAQDSFSVVLDSEPTDDVIIHISIDETEGTALPASLIFTPADWDSEQIITVTGIDDADDDCNQEYIIELSPTSEDLIYNILATQNAAVTNLDDDALSNAGPDQTLTEGNTVTLDGSHSSFCPDLTYRWEKISGPVVTLADPNSAVTTFVPPPIDPNESVSFTFRLTVENSIGIVATDDVLITVNDNGIVNFPLDAIAINCAVGDKTIGVKADSGNLINLISTDPTTIAATAGRPQNLIYGLIDMQIKVNQTAQGETITVTIYLPQPAPEGYTWYKYSVQKGWEDYSDNAVFNDDRTQITLTLTDGGEGDSDGMVNGIITDPSGLGLPTSALTHDTETSDGGNSDGGGCFISSVIQ